MRLGYSSSSYSSSLGESTTTTATSSSLPSLRSEGIRDGIRDRHSEETTEGEGEEENENESKPTHFLAGAGTVGPTGIRKDFIVFDAAPENALDKEQGVGRAGVVSPSLLLFLLFFVLPPLVPRPSSYVRASERSALSRTLKQPYDDPILTRTIQMTMQYFV